MLTAMIVGVFNESYLWMKSAKELGYTIIATHPIDIKDKYYYLYLFVFHKFQMFFGFLVF